MYMTNELIIFIKTLIFGMGVGIIFDIFRIIRKTIPHYDFLVIVQDFLFCILSAAYVFLLVYFLNLGEVRLYILLGILLSNIIYFLCLSKYLINVFTWIFTPFKILFVKIRQKVK